MPPCNGISPIGQLYLYAGETFVLALRELNVKLIRMRRRSVHVGAAPVVGKVFVGLAILNEVFQQGTHSGRDLFEGDCLLLQSGQSLPGHRATDEKGVLAWHTPDKRDVGVVGASATVRTTGHPDQDGFLNEFEIF